MKQYTSITAAIANGAAISGDLDLGQSRAARVAMPAAWTAANLSFQASYDGTTWNDLYKADGTEYTVTAAASRAIILPVADFYGIRFLRIRSGTSGTPVNQAAARSLVVQTVPM